MEAPPHRPPSIRSVASNSSIASAVSLTRRSRTRTRSRTVTSTPRTPDAVPRSPLPSDLPYLATTALHEPPDILDAPLQHASPDPTTVEIRSTSETSSQAASLADPSLVAPTQSTALTSRPSKAAKQASSLPFLDTTGYRPPPSAFSRDPALTPVLNVRDSVSTQQSGVSSSLYPPSTSTASPTSPQSMPAEPEAPPFALEVNDVQEYDSDDVSYRLRLLVKNSYFLPPAHSKPSPADFAPPANDMQKKSPNTFLDIFRVGKSRSKPATPTGAYNPAGPMLRTTSDSIAPPHHPHASAAASGRPPISSNGVPPARGRVVVVREKMQDISAAAKQAEHEIKTRGVRAEQGSHKSAPTTDLHVIDPTDAVDIPLPSPSYPFPVQASALHGLGVLESLGADVLANHLPPGQNPNVSMAYDVVEDSWRKAILQQAVHHSLDNTPDVSMVSQPTDSSSPLSSLPVAKSDDVPRSPAPVSQNVIGQRIMDLSKVGTSSPSPARPKSAHSEASTSKGRSRLLAPSDLDNAPSRPISYRRVETPSGPMTPLAPPPRRAYTNPTYSLSQSQLQTQAAPTEPVSSTDESSPRHSLRRAVSSPLLSEGYESHGTSSPPPVPGYPRHSQATFSSFNTFPTYNIQSDDMLRNSFDEAEARTNRASTSTFASGQHPGRPSFSEYSQSSPTHSAFRVQPQPQPILQERGGLSPSPAPSGTWAAGDQHRIYTARELVVSPPPTREPSALAHLPLPPPPRSSSFAYATVSSQRGYHHMRQRQPQVELDPGSETEPEPEAKPREEALEIFAPEPTSPPLPATHELGPSLSPPPEGFAGSSSNRSAIYIRDSMDLSHTAPSLSSPTSFFDSIQSQPNAMDDLEESSSEDGNSEDEMRPPPSIVESARARTPSSASRSEGGRAPMMKLGNLSVPVIRATGDMSPVENNARSRAPVSSKSGMLASSDFFRYAQEHPPLPAAGLPARPATADQDGRTGRSEQAQESLRRLDGMLLRHMEDEKDTIKRIATTLRQTQGGRRR